ncbi:MAG: 2Fe-2S iron-sulfur cluster-binding protein [Bacteriovoracaceae bacterium]
MKTIKLYPSGKEFPCDDGETVLSALEKNGLALPNNCRAGACGECKIRVKEGQIDQGFVLDMALPQSDREQGYGLMCMAKPTSDLLEIEWGTEDAMPKLFPPRENVLCVVSEKVMATERIVKLRLRTVGKNLRFWPGQYVTLGNEDENIPARCYSIANTPNSDGEIILLITLLESGVTSTWVHEKLQEGDQVKISGPYGTFIGNPNTEGPVLCLAAGSGLAPIISLASAALLRGGFRDPAHILFSARSKKDLLENGLLTYLNTKFRNFDYKYTLTQEKNEGGLEGRIPEILPKLYTNLSEYSIYIAGSPEFVKDCSEKVKELGAKEEAIYSEGFFDQFKAEAPPQDRLL